MTKVNEKKRRRWPWIVLGAAVIAAGILVFGFFGSIDRQRAALAAGQAQDGAFVTAFRGDLSSAATATGKVEAQQEADLSLGISGTVERVLVREGDAVRAGDALVQLETDALARNLATAEQNLIIQEANLAELLDGAGEAELASARASLDSARANLANVEDGADPDDIAAAQASLQAAREAYDELLAGPDQNSLRQAEAALRNADASLRQAQANYDEVAWRTDIGMLPQATQLEQATNNFESAKASYDAVAEGASSDQIEQARASVVQAQASLQKLLDSPTEAELAAAQAQVAQAEATLENLLDGASEAQVAIAQAQVEQARINLAAAQANLDDATLLAPFDGIVTAVQVAEGETAAGIAVSLVDTNSLEVVLDVDEVDIGQLEPGQPAVITLETWPDAEIAGQITRIAPQASQGASAIVSYQVRLSLDETTLPVRVGMTANADLITAARQDVLLAPNQAITPDREAGKYYANLVQTGADGAISTQQVEVTIGLKDGDNTEITSGLQEGDRLSTNAITVSSARPAGGLLPQPPGAGAGGPFGAR